MDFSDLQNPEDLFYAREKANAAAPRREMSGGSVGIGGMRNQISELSKLSDAELADELTKQIAIKKQNGTAGDIDKLARTISPFLNREQRTRLDNIIKTMKKE